MGEELVCVDYGADGPAEAGALTDEGYRFSETQARAIEVYGQLGYERWGSNPRYAFVDGRWMAGHFYSKDLKDSDG